VVKLCANSRNRLNLKQIQYIPKIYIIDTNERVLKLTTKYILCVRVKTAIVFLVFVFNVALTA